MNDKSASISLSKRYLTMHQICEYLSCSKWTIYRLIDKREIPFAAIGKRAYRFDQDAIDKWMQDRTMKTTAEVLK